jgi:hypothetical protein
MDDSLRGVVVHQMIQQNETEAYEDSTEGVSSAASQSQLLVIPAECLETLLTQQSRGTDCTFVVKFADGRQKVLHFY